MATVSECSVLATNGQAPDTALQSWCLQQWRVANVVTGGQIEAGDAGHCLGSYRRLVIKLEDSVGVVPLDCDLVPGAKADREAGDEAKLNPGEGEDDGDQGVVDGDGDMVGAVHDSTDPRMMIQQS